MTQDNIYKIHDEYLCVYLEKVLRLEHGSLTSLPLSKEIIKYRPTNHPTDMRVHSIRNACLFYREVTLPKKRYTIRKDNISKTPFSPNILNKSGQTGLHTAALYTRYRVFYKVFPRKLLVYFLPSIDSTTGLPLVVKGKNILPLKFYSIHVH